MPISIHQADDASAAALAAFAATLQTDPSHFVAYFGEDEQTIAAEIAAVDQWQAHTALALRGERMVGFMLGEVDPAMGRVWWWGPMVSDPGWHEIADALYRFATRRLPEGTDEQECVGGGANHRLEQFCMRHGFSPQIASVQLLREGSLTEPARPVAALSDDTRRAVATLHDAVFPGAHQTGERVVSPTVRDNVVVVARTDGVVCGYAVGQLQPDGAGYVDFLGVAPESRGAGLGRALICGLSARLFERGAKRLQLTVREDNEPARRLYARLGFVDEQSLHPYRLGFQLP